jgi:pyridoxamine 5'-phosphate oxidase
MVDYPEFYNSIEKSWEHISHTLPNAYKNRNNPFRTMNVAYVDNNIPFCRTVVLRECASDMSCLQFHTDYRSPKIKILQKNPNIAVHLYSAKDKMQLSINGVANIHYRDSITQDAWHKTQFLSRKCYLTPHVPSDLSNTPLDYIDHNQKSLFDTEQGYYNFAVIRIAVQKIDFLYLHIHNNQRIIFSKDTQTNTFQGVWCNP